MTNLTGVQTGNFGDSSTTKSIKVLEQDMFCGVEGKRTQFMIELTQVRTRFCQRQRHALPLTAVGWRRDKPAISPSTR